MMRTDNVTYRQEEARDSVDADEYEQMLVEAGVYAAKQQRLNAIGLSIAIPRTFRASRGAA